MLLFTSNDKSESSVEKDSVVLISARTAWISDISSQLVLKDVDNIKKIEKQFLSADAVNILPSTHTIIVDIESASDYNSIVNKIKTLLPSTATCLVVGDSDSIVLSQQFFQAGINYLHYPSQLADIVQRVNNTSSQMGNRRSAIKISILGCKGGIGTSTISYHMAQHIADFSRVPVLLVQDRGGSQDIDIIADQGLDKEVADVSDYFAIKKGANERLADFNDPLLNQYNFSIFDCPIYNLSKDDIEHVLTVSDCVVFVVSHELASIRVAKIAQETNRFLQTVNSGVKREFICLSQIKPAGGAMLSPSDLTALLNYEISSRIPYQRPPGDPSKALRFNGKTKDALATLVMHVLGQNRSVRKGSNNLSGVMQRFFKK